MTTHILVVDDEPSIRELFEDVLGDEGYVVHTVATGHQALAVYQTMPLDLIFIDIMMPEMDGITLCRRITTIPGMTQPPIILMSGGTTVTTIDGPYQAFLAKPFDLTNLLQLIHTLLSSEQS
ncbi:response regulator receiver protein [Herpetosiphon aurantiacus DSM 785]|uniref:Response regulator receiver protein n=1 Tax=Herpetosiphon aurantiacus (strain ATCC 23779 / DSM 785 / 114-95) TaxID=316274 RepID=A9B2E3_HERA2|nr:response regulator receiver protein [Herpetosiphon aurantiacus DSM 785]